MTEGYRSGFASFVGRPNAGKSTLTNAMVGTKVVITSDKPQTTRTVVRGIVNRPDAQLILVDTPGLHRPRTLLGERLNDLVRTTWAEVDVVAVCFPANEKIGPGDRFIVSEMSKVKRTTKVAVATKTDLASPEQIGRHLLDIQALGVEKHHLAVGIVLHPENPVPRRLRLVGDDGQLGADDPVEQRRLAGVGTADERNKP